MSAWIVILLGLQDPALVEELREATSAAPPCATVQVAVERMDVQRDAAAVSKGKLAVKEDDDGRILTVDLLEGRRKMRVTIRGEVAVTEARGKTQEESLAPGEGFHPFDLWRRGFRKELEEDFEISVSRVDPAAPPDAEPKRVRRHGMYVARKTPAAETFRVEMVPRRSEWRQKYGVIRFGVAPGAIPIRTIAIETESGIDTYRLGAVKE